MHHARRCKWLPTRWRASKPDRYPLLYVARRCTVDKLRPVVRRSTAPEIRRSAPTAILQRISTVLAAPKTMPWLTPSRDHQRPAFFLTVRLAKRPQTSLSGRCGSDIFSARSQINFIFPSQTFDFLQVVVLDASAKLSKWREGDLGLSRHTKLSLRPV